MWIYVPNRPKPVKNDWGFLPDGADVDARFLHDAPKGRKILLLQDLIFIDRNTRPWFTPKLTICDGNSIPWPLWSLSGSPFVGLTRLASMGHDFFCANQIYTLCSDEVHEMYYHLARCCGTSPFRAWKNYTAIRLGGPQWDRRPRKGTHDDEIEW